MKNIIFSSGILIIFVTLMSCHREPGEIANHLYVENNSGHDISLMYNSSGIWKNFSEENGEKKEICAIEFFNSGSLQTIFGDTVDVIFGDETHYSFICSNREGEISYIPNDNNILNIESWKEEERIDEYNRVYIFVLNNTDSMAF